MSFKILVIGDIMADETYQVSESRESFEQGEPILANPKMTTRLGGAANLASLFVKLGCEVTLAGVVGLDFNSNWFKDLGINHSGVIYTERPTTRKVRYKVGNKHICRVDYEETGDISTELADDILYPVLSSTKYDHIVFSDYNKGVCTPYVIREATLLTDAFSVDPKYKNWELYAGATIFKPNSDEQNMVFTGMTRLQEGQAYGRYKYYVNTQGRLGVSLRDADNVWTQFRAPKVTEVDSCGAGDLFMAVMVWSYLDGCSIENAIQYAIIATAEAVSRPGICTLADDLRDKFKNQEADDNEKERTEPSDIYRQRRSDQQLGGASTSA